MAPSDLPAGSVCPELETGQPASCPVWEWSISEVLWIHIYGFAKDGSPLARSPALEGREPMTMGLLLHIHDHLLSVAIVEGKRHHVAPRHGTGREDRGQPG